MRSNCCAAIVLAAGASIRLGQPKQLVNIDGESLLRRTSRLALEAGFSPVIVVLGSNANRFAEELSDLNLRTVTNSAWQEGMASSIRSGLRGIISDDPMTPNLGILVCDQPRLSLSILQELLKKHGSGNAEITASSYAGIKGVPVILSQKLFPQLAALRGNEGARSVIAGHEGKVNLIDFPGGQDDIDSPADLPPPPKGRI